MGDGHSEKIPSKNSLLAVFWVMISLTIGFAYNILAGQPPAAEIPEPITEQEMVNTEENLEPLEADTNSEE